MVREGFDPGIESITTETTALPLGQVYHDNIERELPIIYTPFALHVK
jgi:hypothetical protein